MQSLVIIIISLFFIFLVFTERIYLLIHPDYINFNFAMAAFLLLFSVIAVWKKIKINRIDFVILIFFVILIILLPVKPLSSFTASNRNINIANLEESDANLIGLLQRDTKSLTIKDWVKLKNMEPDIDKFAGQDAVILGFVFNPPQFPKSQDENLFIGRFVVTCCAVDASPLGIEVATSDSEGNPLFDSYGNDDWVEVEGKWEVIARDGTKYLVLQPTSVRAVDIPTNPYI